MPILPKLVKIRRFYRGTELNDFRKVTCVTGGKPRTVRCTSWDADGNPLAAGPNIPLDVFSQWAAADISGTVAVKEGLLITK